MLIQLQIHWTVKNVVIGRGLLSMLLQWPRPGACFELMEEPVQDYRVGALISMQVAAQKKTTSLWLSAFRQWHLRTGSPLKKLGLIFLLMCRWLGTRWLHQKQTTSVEERLHLPGNALMSMTACWPVWLLMMTSMPNRDTPSASRKDLDNSLMTSSLGGWDTPSTFSLWDKDQILKSIRDKTCLKITWDYSRWHFGRTEVKSEDDSGLETLWLLKKIAFLSEKETELKKKGESFVYTSHLRH